MIYWFKRFLLDHVVVDAALSDATLFSQTHEAWEMILPHRKSVLSHTLALNPFAHMVAPWTNVLAMALPVVQRIVDWAGTLRNVHCSE